MVSTKEFGKIFKDSREEKGVSIEEASIESKIHQRVIVDIESGIFDRLGAVYVKSFVKKYAGYLGLNTPDILKIFEHITKSHTDIHKDLSAGAKQPKMPSANLGMRNEHLQSPAAPTITPKAPIMGPGSKMRKFGMLINILIPAAVITFIVLFVVSLRSSVPEKKDDLMKDYDAKKKSVQEPAKRSALKTASASTSGQKKTNLVFPDKTAIQKEAVVKTDSSVKKEAYVVPVKKTSVSTREAAKQVVVKLKARGEVWVQVFDEGKTVYVGTLLRGDVKELKTDTSLMVWTGKGENLDFEVNGKFLGKAADGVIRNIKVSREGISIGDKWVKRVE